VKDHGQGSYSILWRNKIVADGDVHSSAIIDPETDAVYAGCGCVTAGQLVALDPTPADMTDGPGETLADNALIRPSVLYISPAQEDRPAPFRYRRVYIGSTDGRLHAFTPPDGPGGVWTLEWSFLPLQKGTNRKSSPVIGDDGTIYMGSYLGLSAIKDNGTSAENKWPPFLTNDRVDAAPALSQNGNTIYIGTATRPYRVYAINANTGAKRWHYPGDNDPPLNGLIDIPAVVGLNGMIYVGAGKTVYALNADGTLAWSYKVGGVVMGISLGEGVGAPIGKGALFVTASDHKLYKLQAPQGQP
jgi:outer membrane protein assembly factor BamB